MDENIQVLPDTLFSLNTPKQQAIVTNIGWTGVTDPEEDRGRDLSDIPDPDVLEGKVRLEQIDNPQLPKWQDAHTLTYHDNAWWYGPGLVVVGNNDLKRGVTSLFHNSNMAEHPGIAKTTQLISSHYWWPGLKNYITDYIKGCATCQMTKVNTNPRPPPLNPITAEPNALPFQTITMDFIVKLPMSGRFNMILTITDHDCLKAAIFIPPNETIDSEGVARLYATNVFPHHGIPKKVITDRDTHFTSNFSRELCHILGVKQNISTAYHPQTDGQSKRMNQSLEQYLRLFCVQDQTQ